MNIETGLLGFLYIIASLVFIALALLGIIRHLGKEAVRKKNDLNILQSMEDEIKEGREI